MGSKSNIELGSGTLYLDGKPFMAVKEVETKDISTDIDKEFDYAKPIDFSGEITGTFKLTFGARVRLFGFWRTVRAEIRRIFGRLWNG